MATEYSAALHLGAFRPDTEKDECFGVIKAERGDNRHLV